MNKVIDITQRIKEKNQQRQELQDQLDRSLAMESLCPGIFNRGFPVKAYLLGSLHPERIKDMKYFVTCGKEQYVFLLSEIPEILQKYHLDRAFTKEEK